MSDGRLELGIGRGFAPADYDRFGLLLVAAHGTKLAQITDYVHASPTMYTREHHERVWHSPAPCT